MSAPRPDFSMVRCHRRPTPRRRQLTNPIDSPGYGVFDPHPMPPSVRRNGCGRKPHETDAFDARKAESLGGRVKLVKGREIESAGAAMFEVTVCSATGETLRRFDLSRLAAAGGRAVIGRAEDCDIRIKSGGVSRHHCAVELDEGDWVIRDLGSTHGTLVEGVSIAEAAIVSGLEVVIGPAVLKFASVANHASRIAAEIGRDLADDPG